MRKTKKTSAKWTRREKGRQEWKGDNKKQVYIEGQVMMGR